MSGFGSVRNALEGGDWKEGRGEAESVDKSVAGRALGVGLWLVGMYGVREVIRCGWRCRSGTTEGSTHTSSKYLGR